MDIFKIYVLLINLITFLFFAADKWKAIHHRWRIQESMLLGLAVLGGAFGGLLAMRLFRHKTQKPKFSIGLPVLLILQLLLSALILRHGGLYRPVVFLFYGQ